MPACSRCLVEVFPGTRVCPSCGAAIRPSIPPKAAPKKPRPSRRHLDNLNRAERITGPATLALLISFWMPWYSVGPFSVDGLSAHGWLFVAMLDSIVLVLYVVLTAFDVGDLAPQGRLSKEQLLSLLTGVSAALVLLAFVLKPTGLSWSWGAYLALVAAVVAFLPFGVPLVQARRGR